MASGREPHAEKITVYLTQDEMADLTDFKARLYRHHGVNIDRGRIVREFVIQGMEDDYAINRLLNNALDRIVQGEEP